MDAINKGVFDMMEIKVTLTDHPKAKPDENNLGFGHIFTDHMFLMDYTADQGFDSSSNKVFLATRPPAYPVSL